MHICFTLVAEFSHKAARRRPLFNTQLCTDTSSSLWLPCCQSRRLLILPSSAQAHSTSLQAKPPFQHEGCFIVVRFPLRLFPSCCGLKPTRISNAGRPCEMRSRIRGLALCNPLKIMEIIIKTQCNGCSFA